MKVLFRILDFIRMIPWYAWYAISCAYVLTIGRIIAQIRYRIATKKADRGWREFMENARFGRR